MGGSAYLVGEEGPELFVPDADGGIIPNGAGASLSIGTLVLNGVQNVRELFFELQEVANSRGLTLGVEL